MGNSRTMLIAAISAVLGLYSLSIKKADQRLQTIPLAHAHKMQAKEISKAGLGIGITRLVKNKNYLDRANGKAMLDGTLDYYVLNYSLFGWNWAYITATGKFKGQTVTQYAWVQEVKKNKWKIVRQYVKTSNNKDEYTSLDIYANP